MVVPTGAVVCGRADGLHRPIERFSCEWLSGSIGPDAGRGATSGRWTVLSIQRRRARDSPPYLSLRAGGPATLSLGRLAELRRAPATGGLRIAGGLDRG